jgi:hypothetical protein
MSFREVFLRLNRWINTFRGAMICAIISFLCLLSYVREGDGSLMAWAMGICTLWYLYLARKALKTAAIDKEIEELSEDQKARIQEATDNVATVLLTIDRELTMAAREKARVQSNKRADQEAGKEGSDGRTDSKEDR